MTAAETTHVSDPVDLFSAVVGSRRGVSGSRSAVRERTDLDRVRELAPLVAASILGRKPVANTVALRHRAHALRIEVVRGQFATDDECDVESEWTVLLSPTGALIGVVAVGCDGVATLLRSDGVRWRP
jgi:hypothetical protein